MDPDKLLEEIRALATAARDWQDDNLRAYTAAHSDLAERVQALDEWLLKGGALPREWLLALGRKRTT